MINAGRTDIQIYNKTSLLHDRGIMGISGFQRTRSRSVPEMCNCGPSVFFCSSMSDSTPLALKEESLNSLVLSHYWLCECFQLSNTETNEQEKPSSKVLSRHKPAERLQYTPRSILWSCTIGINTVLLTVIPSNSVLMMPLENGGPYMFDKIEIR